MGALNSFNTLFLISFLLPYLMFITTSQAELFHHTCSQKRNYTNDSPFKKNLDTVLASILSNSNADTRPVDYGFYNATAGGDDPDRANAKILCRKGVTLEQCKSCVNSSVSEIRQVCPNQKEGTGWNTHCQILYSNNSIHGNIILSAPHILYNTAKAPDTNDFDSEMRGLLDGLRENAASGTSIRKSGSGVVKLASPNLFNMYGLVDCFPDMSYPECDDCLRGLQSNLASCCSGSKGSRAMATSCQINYESSLIYFQLLPPHNSAPLPSGVDFASSPSLPPSVGIISL